MEKMWNSIVIVGFWGAKRFGLRIKYVNGGSVPPGLNRARSLECGFALDFNNRRALRGTD
jgi:hypothetical protein